MIKNTRSQFPLCANDVEATNQVADAFADAVGKEYRHETSPEVGSKDFGGAAGLRHPGWGLSSAHRSGLPWPAGSVD